MQTDYEKLKTHYLSYCDEPNRLQRTQAYTIEFITSMHFLLKYLPKGCTLLDCCAAAGAYAFPLAEEGYQVTAGDLIQEHVNILNEKNKNGLLKSIYQGNTLDLSRFADKSFDAVLCMGALYHLMEEEERKKCISECLRTLKKNGIFAFSYINRNAVYIENFNSNRSNIQDRNILLQTGIDGMFYTMDFNEVLDLVKNLSIEKFTEAGVDGLIYPLKTRLNEATSEEFSSYMEYHIASCEQPSIIGHSMHVLWIGKKL